MFKNLFPKRLKAWNSRRFKRIRASYLVKYQVRGTQEPRITNVRDISAGGLRFWTEDRIPDSSVLNVSVYLPPLDRFVEAVAQVLRVRRAKEGMVYYVAVRFLDLRSEDREGINRFAEALSRDEGARFLIDHARVVVRSQ